MNANQTEGPILKAFRSQPSRIWKSLDPLWNRWGAHRTGTIQTKWFVRKSEAEHYIKTGDDSRAVA